MSVWTVRFLATGARSTDGTLVGRPTSIYLIRQLPGTPVCATWVNGTLGHPYVGARMSVDRAPASIIGEVLGARLLSDGVYGLVSITRPAFDEFLLREERAGRLMKSLGLSLSGRTETVPRTDNDPDPIFFFTDRIVLDVVHGPIGGGCFLQSDVAEAAGRPCPVPPKFTPPPRPVPRSVPSFAREHRGAGLVRYDQAGPRARPLVTEFRVIQEGADY